MMFEDRFHAGKVLAERLVHYKGKDPLVLAVPPGGVQTGVAVASQLGVPLQPALVNHIRHPFNLEYVIGAVGTRYEVVYMVPQGTEAYVEAEIRRLRSLLNEDARLFLSGGKLADPKGKIVILVADGAEPGSGFLDLVALLRKSEPSRLVVALPVAPRFLAGYLGEKVDELVCLHSPAILPSVQEYYAKFPGVSREEAVSLLNQHNAAFAAKS